MKRKYVILTLILVSCISGGCSVDSNDSSTSSGTEIVTNEDDHYIRREDENEYSWLIPQADHENFTAEEKKQIEADTLLAATEVWESYENVSMDESLPPYSSGIVGFTKEQRIEVSEALGQLGLIAVTEDADTQNGELLQQFYNDYLSGKTGMITIYKVYEDGMIRSITFLCRDKEIQSYYVGVRPGADGQPCISEKSVQEIAAVNFTPRLILKDESGTIAKYSFDVANDGANVHSDSWQVTWKDTCVEAVISGEEQNDCQYILYYNGKKDSNPLETQSSL